MKQLFLLLSLVPALAQAQIRPVCAPYVLVTPASDYVWSTPKFGLTPNGLYFKYTCWGTKPGLKTHSYTYVGLPTELSKISGRVSTIVKAADPLVSLQTYPDRNPMLPATDLRLQAIFQDAKDEK